MDYASLKPGENNLSYSSIIHLKLIKTGSYLERTQIVPTLFLGEVGFLGRMLIVAWAQKFLDKIVENYTKREEEILMRKKYLLLTALICGLLMPPTYASAVLINFDDLTAQSTLSGNIEGVNLGGVTITSETLSTTVVSDFGVGYRSASNAITNESYLASAAMTFVFDAPTDFVKFTGGDRGGDLDQFTVDLFNSAGDLLLTFSTPTFGGNFLDSQVMVDFYTVDLSGPGIKTMVVGNASLIGIDDLEFGAVPAPEPTTMLLLGSGLLGLVVYRKKWFFKK